jgi:hypothetical protein
MRSPQPTKNGLVNGTQSLGPSETLLEAIVLTSEVCGRTLSRAAAAMLAQDLADFDEAAILGALARCRMELQGPLRATDIVARLDDGRPGVDEAWAMMPRSEAASVVWTDEMARAWGEAAGLLAAGDVAGARKAFNEAYLKAVLEARLARKPVRWMPSLGSDPAERESVLADALKKQRLSLEHVAKLLPEGSISTEIRQLTTRLKLKKFH